jgi:phosphomannomutase
MNAVPVLDCFKAYDIRGRVPDQLNEAIATRIGRAYAQFVGTREVVVGRDIRLSSDSLARSVIDGLNAAGADVLDIGVCGTEEVYYATAASGAGGGIMVTASHNPPDYNGMKFVREGARPISGDTGLDDIRRLAESADFTDAEKRGGVRMYAIRPDYARHLLSYVERDALKPLTIVVNAGNGGAGAVIDALEPQLPFRFVKLHHAPDGTFPNGVPNPLLPENRQVTADAVVAAGADFGIAWDGDFDRCFLFDERGHFIEGYYIVGLLAEAFLRRHPGEKIIHDPRLVWNTIDVVRAHGGTPIESKTGHAFIKERMRAENAIYGGEMSAHHYFRDFAYCDSGMIPWLLVAELVSRRGEPLSSLVAERQARYPVSGEINRRLDDPAAALATIEARYGAQALEVTHIDGLSMAFPDWRFNLRSSNTEPLLRLNVESRGDESLMRARTDELLNLLDSNFGATAA